MAEASENVTNMSEQQEITTETKPAEDMKTKVVEADAATKEDTEAGAEVSNAVEAKRKRSESPAGNEDEEGQNKRNKHNHGNRDEHQSQNKQRNRNIKSQFDQEESSDPGEIRRQVEFYFGDANLPVDKFLLGLVGAPPSNNPVDLKTIHNFKRMQRYQPFSAVREAIKESTFFVLHDNDQISRRVPLDAKFTDDVETNKDLVHDENMLRSVYAKGFGQETSETHLAIEDFFRLYAQFKSIRLRRDKWGVFKGSVFVEFEDEKAQKDFLELDPKPEFDGTELKIMSKKDYVEWKNQGILDGTVRPRSPLGYNNRNNGFKKNNRGKFAKQRGKHGHKWEKKDGARNRDRRHRRDYDESRSRSRSRGDRRSRRDKDDVRSVSRSPAPHRNSDEGGDYRSRSRSRDRDREDRRGRYDRKTRRSSYKGDLDDWKARKDHEVKEKETKKRRRMDGEESEDEISKLSKKVKADE